MASRIPTLSKSAREHLALHLAEPWMQELVHALIETASVSDRTYHGARALSEMEHQALNGSFREGWISCTKYIQVLASEPKAPEPPIPSFGDLQPEVQNPKQAYKEPTARKTPMNL
jgi:hypothetical protein